MASIPHLMRDRIQGDATLMALLTGGVYIKPLTRNSTPAAFRKVGQDPANPARIWYNPAMSIRDPFYTRHPLTDFRATAYSAIQDNHIYCESNDTDKEKIRQVIGRLVRIFDDWYEDTDYGTRVFFKFYGADPIGDAEEFEGASKTVVRFTLTGAFVADID